MPNRTGKTSLPKGRKVKPKPLPIEISQEEYVEILKVTELMHHKIAFMLGFESGLRISEIVHLQKADFDFVNKQIRVNMGKFSKDRIVSLPLSWQPSHINFIPLKCQQRALQKALIKSAIETGLKAKKPKVHFHSLRHGFATECLRSGIDLVTIQGLLGHEDLGTTAIYVNLCPAERIQKYRNKFGGREK